MARRDEQVGGAGARPPLRRLQRPQRGGADGDDPAAFRPGPGDGRGRRLGHDVALAVHAMVLGPLHPHRQEGPRSDVKGDVREKNFFFAKRLDELGVRQPVEKGQNVRAAGLWSDVELLLERAAERRRPGVEGAEPLRRRRRGSVPAWHALSAMFA